MHIQAYMWKSKKQHAGLIMPNSSPRDGIFNPHLTTIKVYYNVSFFLPVCLIMLDNSKFFIEFYFYLFRHSSSQDQVKYNKNKCLDDIV